ncbi:hypothetical protein ACFQY7_20830 [Actinomadura luteofluorescens]|uniref:hypothetical protein n=1 Tax=Actinomadura luteofluorescens TaxID=46163 RepID=UPI0036420B1E
MRAAGRARGWTALVAATALADAAAAVLLPFALARAIDAVPPGGPRPRPRCGPASRWSRRPPRRRCCRSSRPAARPRGRRRGCGTRSSGTCWRRVPRRASRRGTWPGAWWAARPRRARRPPPRPRPRRGCCRPPGRSRPSSSSTGGSRRRSRPRCWPWRC